MARKHLTIENLTIKHNRTTVLDNVCMKVKNNEFISIIGKSGCGKTTLLQAIANFIPYEGKIMRPKKVGMVFQNYAIFPWLTVYQNIAFGTNENQEIEYLIDKIGLKDRRNSYPYELSGGQVQRVALARTLASNPDLILMDEPYGALDSYTRDNMQQWLLKIWNLRGKTILFVTHSIEEAIYLSSRILILKNKRIYREFRVPFSRPRKPTIKNSEKFVTLKQDITNLIS